MDIEPPAKRRRTSASDSASTTSRNGASRPHSLSRTRRSDHSQDNTSSDDEQTQAGRVKTTNARSGSSSPRHATRRTSNASLADEKHAGRTLNYKQLFNLPNAHDRGITCVKFSPDGKLLATASADASIKIYAVPEDIKQDQPFRLLRTLHTHKAGINAISWSPIGPSFTLASASDDKSILLWNPLSSDFPIPPSPFLGHSNYVYSLAFSPKGNMLVSGSYDEALFLWDARSAKKMKDLPAHSDPVSGVDFVKDGTMVCSCSSDGLIRIWDSGTHQCLKTLVNEDRKAVTAVRFTPNGRYVLAWTLDSNIRLWRYLNTDGGGCVKTYQGHLNTKYSLSGCFGEYHFVNEETGHSSIEAFIVSGSEDGDIVMWDVNTKDIMWRGSGHKDVVLSVDCTKTLDGRGLLASAGKDRSLRVWIEDITPIQAEEIQKETEDVRGHMVQLEIKREDTEMSGS